jgi:hypothetical protein
MGSDCACVRGGCCSRAEEEEGGVVRCAAARALVRALMGEVEAVRATVAVVDESLRGVLGALPIVTEAAEKGELAVLTATLVLEAAKSADSEAPGADVESETGLALPVELVLVVVVEVVEEEEGEVGGEGVTLEGELLT